MDPFDELYTSVSYIVVSNDVKKRDDTNIICTVMNEMLERIESRLKELHFIFRIEKINKVIGFNSES